MLRVWNSLTFVRPNLHSSQHSRKRRKIFFSKQKYKNNDDLQILNARLSDDVGRNIISLFDWELMNLDLDLLISQGDIKWGRYLFTRNFWCEESLSKESPCKEIFFQGIFFSQKIKIDENFNFNFSNLHSNNNFHFPQISKKFTSQNSIK